MAWFKNFEKRADGIWAHEDGLTDLGREAVRTQRYKFTSFVADRRDTQPLGGNRHRILKIDTVGFTNQANGKELLTPIRNRGAERAPRSEAFVMGPQQASDEMLRLANRLKHAHGWTFDRAWQHVTLAEPLINAIANRTAVVSGFVMNRVPGMSEEQLWKIVRATQGAVRERLFRQFDNDKVHTVITYHGTASMNGFVDQLKSVMEELTNGDFDSAWKHLQRTQPDVFANYILAAPEAAAAQNLVVSGQETQRQFESAT